MALGYENHDLVTERTVKLQRGGETVSFLSAGKQGSSRAVVFCHGAAFNAQTWQITGVLDRLAESGFWVVALNLPGYEVALVPSQLVLILSVG